MDDNNSKDEIIEEIKEEDIQEGEIVETPKDNSSKSADEDQSTVITSLDELIKATVGNLERLSKEQKDFRELIADGLNNDAGFKEVSDKAKKVAKEKSQIRSQIMSKTGIIEIVNKLKDVSSDIKEKNSALSDYLLEYQRLTGANQIELENGEILEIVQIAKIVRKANPR